MDGDVLTPLDPLPGHHHERSRPEGVTLDQDEVPLGGEPSGHIILSDYATTGDGFVAALQVLAVVQKLRRPVSEVCHRFDTSVRPGPPSARAR